MPINGAKTMGQFFKFMFASMLGFILGSVVIALIFSIAIAGAIASAGSAFSFGSKPVEIGRAHV